MKKPGIGRFIALIPLVAVALVLWQVTDSLGAGPGEPEGTSDWQPEAAVVPATWLLVDDDDDSPDTLPYYTDTLDGMGIPYDIWTTGASDTEPDLATLTPYQTVVWFTGDRFAGAGGPAGPSAATETVLGQWLDMNRCLFVTSQDYHFDKGLTAFMQSYLGAAAVTDDQTQTTVTGTGTAFGYLGPYSLAYPFANWSDIVSSDVSAETAMIGDQGDAGVNKTSTYRSVFFGFPFEALPDAAARRRTMTTVFTYCNLDCPGTYNLDLHNQMLSGTQTYDVCNAIGAGDNLKILTGADVLLNAWHEVLLRDGFTVEDGAEVTITNTRPD